MRNENGKKKIKKENRKWNKFNRRIIIIIVDLIFFFFFISNHRISYFQMKFKNNYKWHWTINWNKTERESESERDKKLMSIYLCLEYHWKIN